MTRTLLSLALLLAMWPVVARAEEAPVPPLQVRWHGQDVPLTPQAQQDLMNQAIRLVESSNFHSGEADSLPGYQGPKALAEIRQRYRKIVRGSFAVVNFPEPRKVRTIGGEVIVSEIVVALNREDFASDLLTVDEHNAIVGHGKYLGIYCIEFLDAVKSYAPSTLPKKDAGQAD